MLKQYPKVIEAMANRHVKYNETLRYIEGEEAKGNTFVICPEKKLPIGRTERDPQKLKVVYDIGRDVAMKHLEEIKQFLAYE